MIVTTDNTTKKGAEIMKIRVKKWWYEQEQTKAQKYDWTLCWENIYKDKEGKIYSESRQAQNEYEMGLLDKVGFALYGNQLRETEKAVFMELSFWNLRKAGRYVNDAPVETRWKTWIPKSVLF